MPAALAPQPCCIRSRLRQRRDAAHPSGAPTRRPRSAACHESVTGNPWLLGELARQIAAHGPEAVDAARDDAQRVTAIARNVVRRRLASCAPPDRAVIEALAVHRRQRASHVLAAVAGVGIDELPPPRRAALRRAAGLRRPTLRA